MSGAIEDLVARHGGIVARPRGRTPFIPMADRTTHVLLASDPTRWQPDTSVTKKIVPGDGRACG